MPNRILEHGEKLIDAFKTQREWLIAINILEVRLQNGKGDPKLIAELIDVYNYCLVHIKRGKYKPRT